MDTPVYFQRFLKGFCRQMVFPFFQIDLPPNPVTIRHCPAVFAEMPDTGLQRLFHIIQRRSIITARHRKNIPELHQTGRRHQTVFAQVNLPESQSLFRIPVGLFVLIATGIHIGHTGIYPRKNQRSCLFCLFCPVQLLKKIQCPIQTIQSLLVLPASGKRITDGNFGSGGNLFFLTGNGQRQCCPVICECILKFMLVKINVTDEVIQPHDLVVMRPILIQLIPPG